ncbi:MAG TPA: O-antigen ligase family protein [Jiangellaceae bacterium]
MSATAARRLLFVAAFLIVWGPPALRPAGRDLNAALADPFALDAAAVLQVGAWVFADALVLLLLISHLARRTDFLSNLLADKPLRWYGLYGLLALGSVTYTQSVLYTTFFAQKILVALFVLALLEWHWPARRGSRALQVLFWVYGLQAAAIGILYFVRREWVTPFGAVRGSEPVRVTGGVFADYGSSALIAGLFLLTVALFGSKPAHRWLAGVAYVGTWALIVLSQTRTTMAAAVAFLIIMVHAHWRARTLFALVATAAGVGLVALLPTALEKIISVGTRDGEGLETLSGRTEAFSHLIDHWRDSPLIGYGFGSGTRNALVDFVERRGLNIGAGHDAISTVLVDLGLIGLSLLLVAFISAWVAFGRLYRATASDRLATVTTHQVACLLVWVTFNAVVDKGLAGPFAVFMVAIVAVRVLRKQAGDGPYARRVAAPEIRRDIAAAEGGERP